MPSYFARPFGVPSNTWATVWLLTALLALPALASTNIYKPNYPTVTPAAPGTPSYSSPPPPYTPDQPTVTVSSPPPPPPPYTPAQPTLIVHSPPSSPPSSPQSATPPPPPPYTPSQPLVTVASPPPPPPPSPPPSPKRRPSPRNPPRAPRFPQPSAPPSPPPSAPDSCTCNSVCPNTAAYTARNLTCASSFLHNYDHAVDERAQFDITAPASASAVLVDLLAEDGSIPLVTTPGGKRWLYDQRAFPYLAKAGSSVNVVQMQACSSNLPHVHPRGSETLVVIQGQFNLTMVEENGGRVATQLMDATGPHLNAFVVPQGLPHAEHNLGCDVAIFVAVFNNPDAGVVSLAAALAKFPTATLSTAFGITADEAVNLAQGAIHLESPALGDAACLARCGIKQ